MGTFVTSLHNTEPKGITDYEAEQMEERHFFEHLDNSYYGHEEDDGDHPVDDLTDAECYDRFHVHVVCTRFSFSFFSLSFLIRRIHARYAWTYSDSW